MKYCSIEACKKPHHARGYCGMHNARYVRWGDPNHLTGREREYHGRSHSRIYTSWQAMVKRCTNPNDPAFSSYGGRGIRVCDRWLYSFDNFWEDMGERPLGKTIDRIDNDGNYEPTNCRWATKSEQMVNRRTNRNNTSSMRGVSRFENKWRACAKFNYTQYHLGLFETVEEAALAYDAAMFQLHGENAHTNYQWAK